MKNTILSKINNIKSTKKNSTLKVLDIFQVIISIILIITLSIVAYLTLDNNSKVLLNITSVICLILFYDGYTNLNKNRPKRVEKLGHLLNKYERLSIIHS